MSPTEKELLLAAKEAAVMLAEMAKAAGVSPRGQGFDRLMAAIKANEAANEVERNRISVLTDALRPFSKAADVSDRADKHHKIKRAPDEEVGVMVKVSALHTARIALDGEA